MRKIFVMLFVVLALSAVPVARASIIRDQCKSLCQKDYEACKAGAVLDEDYAWCAADKTACISACPSAPIAPVGNFADTAPAFAACQQ